MKVVKIPSASQSCLCKRWSTCIDSDTNYTRQYMYIPVLSVSERSKVSLDGMNSVMNGLLVVYHSNIYTIEIKSFKNRSFYRSRLHHHLSKPSTRQKQQHNLDLEVTVNVG